MYQYSNISLASQMLIRYHQFLILSKCILSVSSFILLSPIMLSRDASLANHLQKISLSLRMCGGEPYGTGEYIYKSMCNVDAALLLTWASRPSYTIELFVLGDKRWSFIDLALSQTLLLQRLNFVRVPEFNRSATPPLSFPHVYSQINLKFWLFQDIIYM